MTNSFLIAGFGGQGLLFAGKFLAHKGMLEDKEVSWLPSYGPEMRGGTANCSVIISDSIVGSPIVDRPDILVAMNLPSLDKYENAVVPGGMIFADSSMIDREVRRTDVKVFAVPATKIAGENGNATLANMILMGKVLKEMNAYNAQTVEAAVRAVVPAKRAQLITANLQALGIGSGL